MTKKNGRIRLLLGLAAFSAAVLGRVLNSPAAGWVVAALILVGATLWDERALKS
jgi:hypothetical protein